ncbi:hypothetical protein [Amycolatopsis sp. cmx-4-68]|uniref:hypothetical protein n=1 Tax=Amycolatopsis sp. cmx-4-68 TaxID=2790938 RepID=UPI00397BA0AC
MILATTAGATGLATAAGRVVAAVIALVSAALSAAAAFLNSQEQRKTSGLLCAAWQELADARMEHRRKGHLLRGDVPHEKPTVAVGTSS